MNNIRQHGRTDCGETCLAGIAEFYGRAVSTAQIRQLTVRGSEGASLAQLQSVAERLGFLSACVKGHYEALAEATLPAIVHLDGPKTGAHFVVLEQVALHHVRLCDPADGKKHDWARTKFERYWTGAALLLFPGPLFHQTYLRC